MPQDSTAAIWGLRVSACSAVSLASRTHLPLPTFLIV